MFLGIVRLADDSEEHSGFVLCEDRALGPAELQLGRDHPALVGQRHCRHSTPDQTYTYLRKAGLVFDGQDMSNFFAIWDL